MIFKEVQVVAFSRHPVPKNCLHNTTTRSTLHDAAAAGLRGSSKGEDCVLRGKPSDMFLNITLCCLLVNAQIKAGRGGGGVQSFSLLRSSDFFFDGGSGEEGRTNLLLA